MNVSTRWSNLERDHELSKVRSNVTEKQEVVRSSTFLIISYLLVVAYILQ